MSDVEFVWNRKTHEVIVVYLDRSDHGAERLGTADSVEDARDLVAELRPDLVSDPAKPELKEIPPEIRDRLVPITIARTPGSA